MRYYYDSSVFDGTVTVYFEAGIKVTAGTGYVELFNYTDSTSVAEVTSTNTSGFARVRSASSVTMTTGKEYTIRLRNDTGGESITIGGARLVIQQSGSPIRLTESYADYQLAHSGRKTTPLRMTTRTPTRPTPTIGHLNLFEPQMWSRAPTVYHEITYKMSTSSYACDVQMYDNTHGTYLDIAGGTSTSTTRLRNSTPLSTPSTSSAFDTRLKVDNIAAALTLPNSPYYLAGRSVRHPHHPRLLHRHPIK